LRAGLIDPATLIIDAKSGTTGAGRKANEEMSFSEVADDFRAYRVLRHQHTPEIERVLALAGVPDPHVTVHGAPPARAAGNSSPPAYGRLRGRRRRRHRQRALESFAEGKPVREGRLARTGDPARQRGDEPRGARREGRARRGGVVRLDRQPRQGRGGAGRAERERDVRAARDHAASSTSRGTRHELLRNSRSSGPVVVEALRYIQKFSGHARR
jgi:hypothetical protein